MATLVRQDDCIVLAEKQTECEGCSEYVLVTQVSVRHLEMAGRHTYPLVYHLPCWLKVGQRPKDKPLSQYKGFDRIPRCLYEEVFSAYPDSPKNIRVDPSSPSPMSKPTMRRLAKRCLATTRDGTQCRWNSESNHPKAARLLQEDCYTCNQHADCEISQAAIRASESKRKVDSGVKLFQFDQNEEKKRKRARRS